MKAPNTPTGPEAELGRLTIVRGKTRQPIRPIHSLPYLIGSGAICSLQLADDHIPMVHCMLHQIEQHWHVTAMHPEPKLLVNGKVVQRAVIEAGDRLGIGGVELELLELNKVPDTRKSHVLSFPPVTPPIETVELDLILDQLSASIDTVEELTGAKSSQAEPSASQIDAFLAELNKYSLEHEQELSAGELSESLEQMLQWLNTPESQPRRKSA